MDEPRGCPEAVDPLDGRWTLTRQGYLVKQIGGRQVKQHRLIMSRHLGRPLLPHETVHHISGDRADNRIENLELWSSSQPPGQRVEDKVGWALEILALYDPDMLQCAECGHQI